MNLGVPQTCPARRYEFSLYRPKAWSKNSSRPTSRSPRWSCRPSPAKNTYTSWPSPRWKRGYGNKASPPGLWQGVSRRRAACLVAWWSSDPQGVPLVIGIERRLQGRRRRYRRRGEPEKDKDEEDVGRKDGWRANYESGWEEATLLVPSHQLMARTVGAKMATTSLGLAMHSRNPERNNHLQGHLRLLRLLRAITGLCRRQDSALGSGSSMKALGKSWVSVKEAIQSTSTALVSVSDSHTLYFQFANVLHESRLPEHGYPQLVQCLY